MLKIDGVQYRKVKGERGVYRKVFKSGKLSKTFYAVWRTVSTHEYFVDKISN